MDKELINAAIAYIQELFRDNAGGHDAEHTMRVYRNACEIADTEPECDRKIVALAALLHDADDHKLFQTENMANARRFLENSGVSDMEIEAVCCAIRSVSFSKNRGRKPDTIEGMIVQDADRLDAMGAVGIARTFAYGGEHGRPMEDSIGHFHEKLLLLRKLMNTEMGKEMAESRHRFLEEFLREYRSETEQ
ncbi:MAG: HD domain-containing protein [Eubacterium sp.]|nr:HD domain-containing protein [Eubacterium sp.]